MGVKNKIDKEGKLVHNEARVVLKGYSKQEGIDHEKRLPLS